MRRWTYRLGPLSVAFTALVVMISWRQWDDSQLPEEEGQFRGQQVSGNSGRVAITSESNTVSLTRQATSPCEELQQHLMDAREAPNEDTLHVSGLSLHPWSSGEGKKAFMLEHFIEELNTGGIPDAIFHVHHACVGGKHQGVGLPHLQSFYKAFNVALGGASDYLEWGGLTFHQLASDELQVIWGGDEAPNTRFVNGSTYLFDCWSRWATDVNPMHLLMKLYPLYELSEGIQELRRAGKPMPLPAFQGIATHRCPSTEHILNNWPLGKLFWETSFSNWTNAGLGDPRAMELFDFGDPHGALTCFQDLYMDFRYGRIAGPHFESWNLEINRLLDDQERQPDAALATDTWTSLATRCEEGTVRIGIVKRPSGSELRQFRNFKEVEEVAQTFTLAPVATISLDETNPLPKVAAAWRRADLFITPHGSQIVNIIFTNVSDVAVIEVIPVESDTVFRWNVQLMGARQYRISTGHAPIKADGSEDCGPEVMQEHCKYEVDRDIWTCDDHWIADHMKRCDQEVNTDVLRRHINETLADLCRLT